jgi:hypothetical protein
VPEAPIHTPPDAQPVATASGPDAESEGSSSEPGDKPGAPSNSPSPGRVVLT